MFSRILLGRHLRLVANRVERRRDDLALLLRQLADLIAGTAAAATAAGHRLRRLVVLAERPDLHEVDVARRRLAAGHGVVVGRLRVVRHEVAGLEAQLFEVDRVAWRSLRAASSRRRTG